MNRDYESVSQRAACVTSYRLLAEFLKIWPQGLCGHTLECTHYRLYVISQCHSPPRSHYTKCRQDCLCTCCCAWKETPADSKFTPSRAGRTIPRGHPSWAGPDLDLSNAPTWSTQTPTNWYCDVPACLSAGGICSRSVWDSESFYYHGHYLPTTLYKGVRPRLLPTLWHLVCGGWETWVITHSLLFTCSHPHIHCGHPGVGGPTLLFLVTHTQLGCVFQLVTMLFTKYQISHRTRTRVTHTWHFNNTKWGCARITLVCTCYTY